MLQPDVLASKLIFFFFFFSTALLAQPTVNEVSDASFETNFASEKKKM